MITNNRYRILSGCALLFVALIYAAGVLNAKAQSRFSPASAEFQTFSIQSAQGEHRFQVETATSPDARSKGLMDRVSLPPNQGMLFVYQPARQINMWMKDTLIPLDMVFFGPGGKIIRIETNTEPLSLRNIGSGGASRAVLEINAGLTEQLGIKVGDQALHSIFSSRH